MASIRKHFTQELSNQAHHTCLVGEAQVEIAVEDERLAVVDPREKSGRVLLVTVGFRRWTC